MGVISINGCGLGEIGGDLAMLTQIQSEVLMVFRGCVTTWSYNLTSFSRCIKLNCTWVATSLATHDLVAAEN